MFNQKFKSVRLESYARSIGPEEVTSTQIEDKLAPLLTRLGVPMGTLERLSGIVSRRFWPRSVLPSQIAREAAEVALEQTKVPREKIGVIINCSVSRDYFEPATSTVVHKALGFSPKTVAFDITNACLGFSNSLSILGTMIDAGQIEAGLIVSGETVTNIFENTMESLLRRPDIDRDSLLKLLPVLTLGCGGVAAVVCHEKYAPDAPKPVAMISRTESQYSDLCEGNGDFSVADYKDLDFSKMSVEELSKHPLMFTEASKLITSASKVGGAAWRDMQELIGWDRNAVDHVFCHQVGRQVNEAFYKEIGLDMSKEFNIYKDYGNMVTSALPSALFVGAEEKPINKGDKVVTMGFGSGLNTVFTAWVW